MITYKISFSIFLNSILNVFHFVNDNLKKFIIGWYLCIEVDLYNAGLAEPGVQGVQQHTHFLAPLFSKDQVLSQKHVITY